MDSLNHDERAHAWLASWNPSFDGKAVINSDFSFRAVNQQFCKILGVTPGDLMGNKFTDITPEPIKSLEVKNSILVRRGDIRSFLMPKTFELLDGRKIDTTLLVNGVYHPKTDQFMFFVATIMERQKMNVTAAPSQPPIGLLDFADKKRTLWAVLTALGIMLAALLERLFK